MPATPTRPPHPSKEALRPFRRAGHAPGGLALEVQVVNLSQGADAGDSASVLAGVLLLTDYTFPEPARPWWAVEVATVAVAIA